MTNVIILAAGTGSRLRPLTDNVPKCMVPFLGKSILKRQIEVFSNSRVNEITIVAGHLENKIKCDNLKKIFNPHFGYTNMVYSLFCAYKYLNKFKEDIVISYSDIVFDKSIFKTVQSSGNFLVVYSEWLKIWKLRMKPSMIINDAESLVVKNNNLISIGNKIKDKMPKYQYTGIIKLRFNSFTKLYNYFKKLKNDKIDFTRFLNLSIGNKIINMKIKKTKKFWFEVDSLNDAKALTLVLKEKKLFSSDKV